MFTFIIFSEIIISKNDGSVDVTKHTLTEIVATYVKSCKIYLSSMFIGVDISLHFSRFNYHSFSVKVKLIYSLMEKCTQKHNILLNLCDR